MLPRFFFFSALTLFGCTQKRETNSANRQPLVDSTRLAVLYSKDTSIKEERGEPHLTNIARLLCLPPINKGTNDNCIRIWFWNTPGPNYVVDIRERGEEGELDVWEFGSSVGGDSVVRYQGKSYLLTKAIWPPFADSLRTLGIRDLPGFDSSLEKLGSVACHGAYVNFEITSQGAYRYYEYLDPYYFRYVDESSSRIDRFLLYLNQEVEKRIYQPSYELYAKPSAEYKSN